MLIMNKRSDTEVSTRVKERRYLNVCFAGTKGVKMREGSNLVYILSCFTKGEGGFELLGHAVTSLYYHSCDYLLLLCV